MMYKYIVKNVASPAWQNRHLHAQADLRGQRYRHAYPPEYLERGSLCLRGRSMPGISQLGLYYIGGILEARAGPGGVYESDDKLLQAG